MLWFVKDYFTFDVCASSTSLTICDSIASDPTCVAFIVRTPFWLIDPPITESSATETTWLRTHNNWIKDHWVNKNRQNQHTYNVHVHVPHVYMYMYWSIGNNRHWMTYWNIAKLCETHTHTCTCMYTLCIDNKLYIVHPLICSWLFTFLF